MFVSALIVDCTYMLYCHVYVNMYCICIVFLKIIERYGKLKIVRMANYFERVCHNMR